MKRTAPVAGATLIVAILEMLGVCGCGSKPISVQASSVIEGPASPMDLPLVSGIARSSDGNMIATVSDSKVVKLWDAKSAQLLHVLQPADNEWLFSPAFSPDGSVLATASSVSTRTQQFGRLQLWNTATGARLFTVQGLDWPKCVRFSPLGNFVIVGATGDLYVVDAATYTLVQHVSRPHSRALVTMGIDPSGNLVATGGQDGTIKLWKMPLLEPVRTFNVGTMIVKATVPGEGYGSVPPASIAFSHDGKLLAANNTEGTAYVWDLASGNEIVRYDYGPLKHGQLAGGALPDSLAFTSDDRWLIATDRSGTGLRLLGVAKKNEVLTPIGTHTDVPISAFDASASNDSVAFVYRVYSTTGQPATGKFEIWNLQLPQ